MKLKRLLFTSPIFLAGMILTSCASYNASPLCSPTLDLIQMAPINGDVMVVAKEFTHDDCNRFLDRDVIEEGYQPIQLYIQNESDKAYFFYLNQISLPTAIPAEVARTVHTSTAGRVAGYAVGSLFLWPLIIPAVVDGIKSSEANKALDNDFINKAARDQVIFPHSRFNSIIFVPTQNYQENFKITLVDQKSSETKTFDLVSRR